MNRKGVFLIIFIMLLSLVIVPTGPVLTINQPIERSTMSLAAAATTGTVKVIVSEDVGVLNGTYADMNFGLDGTLYLGTGDEGTWATARSWFKFNLTHLSAELSITKATMNVYCNEEWSGAGGTDEPVGVYPCDDDSWDDMVITWNTQPAFSSTATDIIDSPASPDMFVAFNWYAWDITTDVENALSDDKILTEVLKQVTEWGSQNAFWYPFDASVSQFYATYIEIEYSIPTTSGLTINGISSGPLLDYIHDGCPDLGWTFSDSDPGDFQRDYDVEVWDNQYYNGSKIWKNSHETVYTIHNSFGDTPPGNSHPFGNHEEFRLQMKYPSSLIPYSGIVDKLYFTSSVDSGILSSENLEISMVMVEDSSYLTADLEANFDGRTPTIVLSRDLYQLEVVDGVVAIDIENTFMVNKDLNLIIEIRLTNNTGDFIRLNRTESGGPGSVATANGPDQYTATTADYLSTRTYDLKLGYLTKQVFAGSPVMDNGFPFDTTVGYSGRFQIKYNQTYIDRAGYIDRAFMRVDMTDGNVVFENFSVTLVESPILGQIENGTWTENYGGATPYVVIDEDQYTVRNLGGCIILDFADSFYYSNTHDLLIDIQWDSLVSGALRILYNDPTASSYRAWDLHYGGDFREGKGTAGYDLILDFVNDADSTPLEGCITLVNATRYYWRARTCDSLGMWSEWITNTFKYDVRNEVPAYTDPLVSPTEILIGDSVTVSLDVTHEVGIYQVIIAYGGINHTMTNDGDTYSYSWTPPAIGTVNYEIYMQSNADTWSTVAESFVVQQSITTTTSTTTTTTTTTNTTTTTTGGNGGTNLPLLIGVAVVGGIVVIIVIIVFVKRKPAK